MRDETIISPVSEDQRLQIVEATNSCVEKAGGYFQPALFFVNHRF